MSTISLITDFGTRDWYAGVMKGVMYNIYPAARMVDITHEIKNHSIEQAAFVLASSYSYFSYGSIHVVVVDPGAGGSRDPILLESRGHYFVGPDNGVFTLADHPSCAVYRLDKKEYWLNPVCETFHGRDIFAPVAAHLARGVPVDQLGTRRPEGIVKIDIANAQRDADDALRARVVYVDRFGNCVTNVPRAAVHTVVHPQRVEVGIGKQTVPGTFVKTYEQATSAHPIAVIGSSGFLELSLDKAPFAQRYEVQEGDLITLRFV